MMNGLLSDSRKKIAILTSGGDSPGMNAAISAVARNAAFRNMDVVGIKQGFKGLIEDNDENYEIMDLNKVLDIADQAGTYLRTARCKEFEQLPYQQIGAKKLAEMGVVGIIVIGGDGSFMGARALSRLGIPCIGIPGTIDNDLAYTEKTLGFDTALNVCVDSIREIRATSRSHNRPHVVEVMGRNRGALALSAAEATGAEIVVVPEKKDWDIEAVATLLDLQMKKNNPRATIVVAEGSWKTMNPLVNHMDMHDYLASKGVTMYPGEPISAKRFAEYLTNMCPGAEVRSTVLGYTQRGGKPTALDSIFAFEAGYMAVELLYQGKNNRVIGVKNGITFDMDMEEALKMEYVFNDSMFNRINSL